MLQKMKIRKSFTRIGFMTFRYGRVLLGNYNVLSDSKYNCYFLKIYCGILILCLNIWHFHYIPFSSFLNLTVLEFTCFNVYYLITSQEYFMQFYRGITTSDAVMGFKTLPYVDITILVIVWSALFGRFCLMVLAWPTSFTFAFYLMMLSNDLNKTLVWVLIYVLFARMRVIRKCLKNNFIHVNIVDKLQVDKNVNVIRKCMGYYNNLLDNKSLIDQPLQFAVLFPLLCSLPQWVAGIHHIVRICIKEDFNKTAFTMTFGILFSILIVVTPAFIAELIGNEIDEIKATLVTQLIRCSDQSLRFELEIALQYFQVRPLNFMLCGAVSLNINLLFSVFSICITYVIVVMQFTHFSAL